MPTLICSLQECNNEFHKKPSDIVKNKTGNFYCSSKCYGKTLGEQKQKYKCIICDNVFYEYMSQRRDNKNKACSKKCADLIKTKYHKTIKLRSKIQKKKYKEKAKKDLLTSHIKHNLSSTLNIKYEDISDDLIECKKAILSLKRQIKNKPKN